MGVVMKAAPVTETFAPSSSSAATVTFTEHVNLVAAAHASPSNAPLSTGESPEVPYLIAIIVVLSALLVVIAAHHAYRRWFLVPTEAANSSFRPKPLVESCDSLPLGGSSLKISHSLPDIQEQLKGSGSSLGELADQALGKKVLRQTTLPTVPTRHQSFQRQLSQRLDLSSIQFAVCSLPERPRAHSTAVVGSIMPELYRYELLRQASTESSSASETVECGKLHFTLRYDNDIDGLIVKVLQAKDLPAKDFSGTSDPYVKIYLLPDRKKKFQTKVHRKNLNPIFNEVFIFSVPYKELRTRTLQFSLYDFDRFSRHDLIGQVVLKGLLDSTDLTQEMEYIMDVLCSRKEKVDLGELMLSLCYLPTAGRLTITVIKARNLKAMDITGASDPYVKVALMCQSKRIKKKKTTVKKATLNPVYNEALVFDVPSDNIEDVDLVIKVIDYDRVGTNELMGCCGIGPRFIGIGRDHWLEMLDNPRRPVAQWYALQEALPFEGDAAAHTKPKPVATLGGCLNITR